MMADHNITHTRLVIPGLDSLYAALVPLSVLFLRVIAGVAFMAHGWPKINAPMGAVGMAKGLGFFPVGFGRRFWPQPTSLVGCCWCWAC